MADLRVSLETVVQPLRAEQKATMNRHLRRARRNHDVAVETLETRALLATASFAGDDGINGQDGNDYLVGDAGGESVFGNDGNDFVGGGGGDDFLQGGSETDAIESLIVNNETFRRGDIVNEWKALSRTYQQRVQNIQGGSGTAERLNADSFLTRLGAGATIIDDRVADELIGGGNDDLFVATMGIDNILDLTLPEISF